MFDFIGRRVLPIFLVLSLCISICVPSAMAVGIGQTDGRDMDSVTGWENQIKNPRSAIIQAWAAYYDYDVSATSLLWWLVDGAHLAQNIELGEVTAEQLTEICTRFNSYFNTPVGPVDNILQWCKDEFGTRVISNFAAWALGIEAPLNFVVKKHESSGVSRIWEDTNNLWVVNSKGQYFCYDHSNDPDIWISRNDATHMVSSKKIEIRTGDELNKVAAILKAHGQNVSFTTLVGPTGIQWKAIAYGGQIRANSAGVPYAAPADDPYFASMNGGRGEDTVVKDENGEDIEGLPEGNTTNIDLSGMTITLPDGLELTIDSINYNEGDRTYNIKGLRYDQTTNNYYTYNYHWEYHINYTSITYIGQTEQYDKYYEVYYELPDGRSSADLTKEELEQLNVNMDVIPYGRSTDNVTLRGLYHFDGDTFDSSYWNYETEFVWNEGASLTYMDAGAFNGALYLDEGVHDFSILTNSPIYDGGFIIQFRYYQSATLAPVTDSVISFSHGRGAGRQGQGIPILRFNGAELIDMHDNVLCRLPTGTWNEIAITRLRNVTYYYLNGVCVGEVADRTAFGSRIDFFFGDQQQTYKYFDELRIFNAPASWAGENYTPTSVPFDTNLALVLPTESVGLADEYWSFNEEGNLLPYTDMSFFFPVYEGVYNTTSTNLSTLCGASNYDSYRGKWWTINGGVSIVSNDGYTSFVNNTDTSASVSGYTLKNNTAYLNLFRVHISGTGSVQSCWDGKSAGFGKTYTFTVMLADGSAQSITFNTPSKIMAPNDVYAVKEFLDGGYLTLVYNGESGKTYRGIYAAITPPANGQLDVIYTELVEASEANTGHEWVESVTAIDKDDINKATLAVRTDIPITKYYIGGVRPSVPKKGYVWALVENQRITSLQVYNGQAWEAVDGRIWTGQRWVPYSSYNVVTMQDMYDMQDGTPNYDYIYTEQGFWSWWQKSWNEFTAKFFNVMGNGTGANDPSKLPTDDTEDPESGGQNFTHFIVVLRDGFWSICVGLANAVYGGFEGFADSVSTVGGFFTSYGNGEDSIWLLPLEEGVSVWD